MSTVLDKKKAGGVLPHATPVYPRPNVRKVLGSMSVSAHFRAEQVSTDRFPLKFAASIHMDNVLDTYDPREI